MRAGAAWTAQDEAHKRHIIAQDGHHIGLTASSSGRRLGLVRATRIADGDRHRTHVSPVGAHVVRGPPLSFRRCGRGSFAAGSRKDDARRVGVVRLACRRRRARVSAPAAARPGGHAIEEVQERGLAAAHLRGGVAARQLEPPEHLPTRIRGGAGRCASSSACTLLKSAAAAERGATASDARRECRVPRFREWRPCGRRGLGDVAVDERRNRSRPIAPDLHVG